MKTKIFTSYFAKMAKRKKLANDVYIAVSRTFFCPLKDQDGNRVEDTIDVHFPNVGNYWGYKEYKKNVDREEVEYLADFLCPKNPKDAWKCDDKKAKCINIFLLCFENLKAKYTKKDEEKYSSQKAGEYKRCHRTLLAEILRDEYGIESSEYEYGMAEGEPKGSK